VYWWVDLQLFAIRQWGTPPANGTLLVGGVAPLVNGGIAGWTGTEALRLWFMLPRGQKGFSTVAQACRCPTHRWTPLRRNSRLFSSTVVCYVCTIHNIMSVILGFSNVEPTRFFNASAQSYPKHISYVLKNTLLITDWGLSGRELKDSTLILTNSREQPLMLMEPLALLSKAIDALAVARMGFSNAFYTGFFPLPYNKNLRSCC
jgi:hypothetical protein